MTSKPTGHLGRVLVVLVGALLLATIVTAVSAQSYRYSRRSGRAYSRDVTRESERNGVPRWENDAEFASDVFTFVRIDYSSGGGWGGRWDTDYPDSDLNLSYRLQELTSLKVDPDGKIISLDDPDLLNYPFAYIIEPGRMSLSESEVSGLQHYLENGGFIMVDDFWGRSEWNNFEREMRRAFPDKTLVELPIEHEIFHCVYDLKQKPQIPSIDHYLSGRTHEGGSDGRDVHYKGLFDDDGRMMMVVCHNTDLGDGWEREGVDEGFFKTYSERWAYPMGINIITYAMTH